MVVADTHDNLLLFTNRGRVYQLKAYEVPDTARQGKGLPIVNLVSVDPGETVTAVEAMSSLDDGDYFLMATRRGEIKKTPVREFASVRSSGLIAMSLEAGDEMVAVHYCRRGSEVMLVTEQGQAIRFAEAELRAASRTSGGVRGIRLGAGDNVVTMDVVDPELDLLVVTANGFGKRTALAEFPTQGRGGGGVRAVKVTDRTGPVADAKVVRPTEELVIISAAGLVIRTPVERIPSYGRSSQGVNVMSLNRDDRVVRIASTNGGGASKPGASPSAHPRAGAASGALPRVDADAEPLDGQVESGDGEVTSPEPAS